MSNDNKTENSINPFSQMEEEVLNFWDKAETFKKSVAKEAPKGDYVFYDGPPFATGTPHYGHIVASLMKDVVPRYWTMRGYKVERKWGWDCHGLPIENIAEKELGFKQKKEIIEYGVDKFNELCRSKVLGYVEEWEKVVRRLGRWADMKNSYRTMDLSYMESVWWVFKELWDRNLIYQSYRSIHVCPRCETTLSQMEVSEGYRMVKDLSVVVKFKIQDQNFLDKYCQGKNTSFLAWTTTPWSIPTTMGLAVGPENNYLIARVEAEQYIFVKDRLEYVEKFLADKKLEIINEIKGSEMEHISYLHPFYELYKGHKDVINNDGVYKTHLTDYVEVTDGTGIVTINGAFGEVDYESAKKLNLPIVINVKMDGTFTPEMGEFAGMNVKPIEDTQKTDIEIIKYLAKNNALFAKEKYEHSYPHCWRCETPLINYLTTSWFVNIVKIKEKALETGKEINWSPSHIKEGRFGKWLEGARDWSISRQRFWASVMPIWQCDKCEEKKVFGSVKELEEVSGEKITDIHKHIVDKVTFKCDCGGAMIRVPDVLDTWFDSGSMPYAQMHYPFENKEKFDANFPAEFIAEGVDQTRAWFYYLHVLANAIKERPAFKNVIVNGIVLAEDGKKMSKRLNNYPDPSLIFDKYGADPMRYYLLSSPVMMAENLNFSESGVLEALRKNNMVLWNVYKFYEQYAAEGGVKSEELKVKSENVLDKWILAKLNLLIEEVTKNMEAYDLPKSVRPISDFINELSTWYIRRSRDRFKTEDEADKNFALATTKYVLTELAKVMAPFMPFMAEQLWQKVSGYDFQDENKSVHLEQWPKNQSSINNYELRIIEDMDLARKFVELSLAKRDELGIKIRQPLSKLLIYNTKSSLSEDIKNIIKQEINVFEVEVFEEQFEQKVELITEMTEELLNEGAKRELVRTINAMRKNAGLTIQDRVNVYWNISEADFVEPRIKKVFVLLGEQINKDVLADKIIEEHTMDVDLEKEVKVNGEMVWLGLKKV